MTRFYFGIENLSLTNGQRNTLVSGLQQLGINNNDPQPSKRNHWRIRTDNNAVIFEADFNEANVTIEAFKTRLSLLFGIDVTLIISNIQQTAYGLVVTFTYLIVDRIRVVLFGYDNGYPTWQESRQAASAYLIDNISEWDSV